MPLLSSFKKSSKKPTTATETNPVGAQGAPLSISAPIHLTESLSRTLDPPSSAIAHGRPTRKRSSNDAGLSQAGPRAAPNEPASIPQSKRLAAEVEVSQPTTSISSAPGLAVNQRPSSSVDPTPVPGDCPREPWPGFRKQQWQ
jgi:hypothetical protein